LRLIIIQTMELQWASVW